MSYITARFGVPFARPRVAAPTRPRMTEAEMGKAMADLAASEQHRARGPRKHVHGNKAPRLDYEIVMSDVLLLLADVPLATPAIETRLKRGSDTIRTVTRRLAARGLVEYNQKARRWSLAQKDTENGA